MICRFLIFTCISFSNIYSWAELPRYTVVQDVLSEDAIAQLHKLTNLKSKQLWYGRHNFWSELFEVSIENASKEIVFMHDKEYEVNVVIDTLSKIFLDEIIQGFGVDLSKKRIVLGAYYDRNTVDKENADSSGLFWHRDCLAVDGKIKVADFTLILLVNGKIQNWKGGRVLLQQGGGYKDDSSYSWINSDNPEVYITPRYNQVIIFKNSDTGHMVTTLIPLSDESVHRDVFIINCCIL